MDSSLILLAIIALSGAYLVPNAVRRREQLSAARATDRFSSAMRVLARRPVAEADRKAVARPRGPAERPALLSSPRLGAAHPHAPVHRGSAAAGPVRPHRVSRPSRASRWLPRAALAFSLLLATAGAAASAVAASPDLGVSPDLGLRLALVVAPLWWAVAGIGQLAVVLAALRVRARRRAARRRAAVRLVPLPGRPVPSGAPVDVGVAAGPGPLEAPSTAMGLEEPALALRPA